MFSQKAPSGIFDWVLSTSLVNAFSKNMMERVMFSTTDVFLQKGELKVLFIIAIGI